MLHYDHAARDGSADDARWVAGLAESLALQRVAERATDSQRQSEESLRDARRSFYRSACHSVGARLLATGHTADDQAETVLFRALRGSGVHGLAGIAPRAPLDDACTLVRPLLRVTRDDVLAYLDAIGQPYRTDPSNADEAYTRNWLRHRLLPMAEQRVPGSRANLANLAVHAAEVAATLQWLAEQVLDESSEPGAGGPPAWRLRRAALAAAPPLLVTEALRLAWRRSGWPEQAMTASAWRRLAELATMAADAPPEVFPGAVRVEAAGGYLLLAGDTAGSC